MNPFSLKEKTILVTGASSGIGKSIAIACSQMEANLIITARNSERLAETFNNLEGNKHLQFSLDLTDEKDMDLLIEQLPKLDGVVCNAGIAQLLLLQFTELNDINEIFQINTIAPINLTRLLLKNKKINKGASLVFISSINGNSCSSVGSSIYAATKSALNGFMKGIALEIAPRGIRANCINPGMIDTDFFKESGIGFEELEKDRLKYPLKRFGKPEEVAYATVYLLSDAAQWITGSNLLIDGGYILQ